MADYLDVAIWAIAGGLISLTVGASILANKKVAQRVSRVAIPFAAGALLGTTFFDLLPEADELGEATLAFKYVVLAVVIFFLLERYLQRFHHHHQEKVKINRRATAPLIVISDAVHNALDGVVIGASFLVSPPIGIVTTIAVAAHEIPRKAGDFGVLLKLRMTRSRVLMWNGLSALTTLAAALITFSLGSNEEISLGAVLGFSAGLLIYVAMSDLIPTIHDEAKGKFAALSAVLLVAGVLVVAVATNTAHRYLEEESGHEHSESSQKHDQEEEPDHGREGADHNE